MPEFCTEKKYCDAAKVAQTLLFRGNRDLQTPLFFSSFHFNRETLSQPSCVFVCMFVLVCMLVSVQPLLLCYGHALSFRSTFLAFPLVRASR